MADSQITPPDIEYPDVSDLMEQVPDVSVISDIHSFIETQSVEFKKQNQDVSLEIPKTLILKYGDETKFNACSAMTLKLNKDISKVQIQYSSMQPKMLEMITNILSYMKVETPERKLPAFLNRTTSIVTGDEDANGDVDNLTNQPIDSNDEPIDNLSEDTDNGNESDDDSDENSDIPDDYMFENADFHKLWNVVENIDLKKFELLSNDSLPEALKPYAFKDDVDLLELIKSEILSQIKMITPNNSYNLFLLCEELENWIVTRDIFTSIQKINEMKQNINKHCLYHIPYVFNLNDNFILPVDKFDGNFRVYRIALFSKRFLSLKTQQAKEFLAKLDSEYQQYSSFIQKAVRYIELKIQQSTQVVALSYKL